MSSCWYLQFQSRSTENFLAFPSLECNSVPQQWDTLLYPLHICSFVEAWNTQKVVKRKPTNLSSIISLQFFLNLKFTCIQMHKYELYNLMKCNKRIHLLNHIPVKTWNISKHFQHRRKFPLSLLSYQRQPFLWIFFFFFSE